MYVHKMGLGVCFLLVALFWGSNPTWAAPPKKSKENRQKDSDQKVRQLNIDLTKVKYVPEDQKIYVHGFLPLRDGTVLQLTLSWKGVVGLRQQVSLEKGSFRTVLKLPKKQIVPGLYTLEVSFDPRQQSRRIYLLLPKKLRILPAQKQIYLGDKSKEEVERTQVKEYLKNTLDTLRDVYSELAQRGGYLLAQIKLEHLRAKSTIPHNIRWRTVRKWDQFRREHWHNVYRIQRYNFKRYQKIRFLSPYPQVERLIGQLLEELYKLYVAYTREIYKFAKRKLPPELRVAGVFGIPRTKQRLEKMAARAYKLLGEKGSWRLSALREREEGKFSPDGNTYTSYVMKFRLTKPASWRWNFAPISPTTRLRILPAAPELRGRVVVAVEIQDFPLAENFRDLEKLVEVRTRNRYRGFRKIYAKAVQAKDPTMPKGVRPGYDMLFETKDGKRVFTVRQYYLFCRWHKRVYGILAIAAKGEMEKVEKEVEAICKSFQVLDAPEFKNLAEQEKKERAQGGKKP